MALTFLGDIITQNEQFKHQQELNKEQYERALEFDGTKYQRSVQDMEKAGINPMVAYGNGSAAGATTGAASPTTMSSGMGTSGGSIIGPLINTAAKELFKKSDEKEIGKFINVMVHKAS